jgi:hypothetical protein
MINQQNIFCPMCHNTPQVCQCNPTTIIPADEEQLKRIAKLVEPKKEWVGLTDEEIYFEMPYKDTLFEFARAIEAKLKEKNT